MAADRTPATPGARLADGLTTGGQMAGDPSGDLVFVVCAGRSGSTLLRFLLDAHPDLACPPETRLPAMCAQLATVWQQLACAPAPKDRNQPPVPGLAVARIRQTVNLMIGPYLAQRGKRRYCDKSLGAAEHVGVLREVFPGARFVCLYRHPMDVIASGIEACPWGLTGFGFDGYAASSRPDRDRCHGTRHHDNRRHGNRRRAGRCHLSRRGRCHLSRRGCNHLSRYGRHRQRGHPAGAADDGGPPVVRPGPA
jgi:hypothetical protein